MSRSLASNPLIHFLIDSKDAFNSSSSFEYSSLNREEFKTLIKERLNHHQAFMEILMQINRFEKKKSSKNLSEKPDDVSFTSENETVPAKKGKPTNQEQLGILSKLGDEATQVHFGNIAKFASIPMGSEFLITVKASQNLI